MQSLAQMVLVFVLDCLRASVLDSVNGQLLFFSLQELIRMQQKFSRPVRQSSTKTSTFYTRFNMLRCMSQKCISHRCNFPMDMQIAELYNHAQQCIKSIKKNLSLLTFLELSLTYSSFVFNKWLF